jgi:hypothetical protein
MMMRMMMRMRTTTAMLLIAKTARAAGRLPVMADVNDRGSHSLL